MSGYNDDDDDDADAGGGFCDGDFPGALRGDVKSVTFDEEEVGAGPGRFETARHETVDSLADSVISVPSSCDGYGGGPEVKHKLSKATFPPLSLPSLFCGTRALPCSPLLFLPLKAHRESCQPARPPGGVGGASTQSPEKWSPWTPAAVRAATKTGGASPMGRAETAAETVAGTVAGEAATKSSAALASWAAPRWPSRQAGTASPRGPAVGRERVRTRPPPRAGWSVGPGTCRAAWRPWVALPVRDSGIWFLVKHPAVVYDSNTSNGLTRATQQASHHPRSFLVQQARAWSLGRFSLERAPAPAPAGFVTALREASARCACRCSWPRSAPPNLPLIPTQ